jgi:hypothetical protein
VSLVLHNVTTFRVEDGQYHHLEEVAKNNVMLAKYKLSVKDFLKFYYSLIPSDDNPIVKDKSKDKGKIEGSQFDVGGFSNTYPSKDKVKLRLSELIELVISLNRISNIVRDQDDYKPISDKISSILMDLVKSTGSGAPKIPGKDLQMNYQIMQGMVDQYIQSHSVLRADREETSGSSELSQASSSQSNRFPATTEGSTGMPVEGKPVPPPPLNPTTQSSAPAEVDTSQPPQVESPSVSVHRSVTPAPAPGAATVTHSASRASGNNSTATDMSVEAEDDNFDPQYIHCSLHCISIKPYHTDLMTLKPFNCAKNTVLIDEAIRCVAMQAAIELEASVKARDKKKRKMYELSNSSEDLIMQVLSIIRNISQVPEIKSVVKCSEPTSSTEAQAPVKAAPPNCPFRPGDLLLTVNKVNVMNKKLQDVGVVLGNAIQKSIASQVPMMLDILRFTITGAAESPQAAFEEKTKVTRPIIISSASSSSASLGASGSSSSSSLARDRRSGTSAKARRISSDSDSDESSNDSRQSRKEAKEKVDEAEREKMQLDLLRSEASAGKMVFAFQTEWSKESYPAVIVDVTDDYSNVLVKWDSNGNKIWIPLHPSRIQIVDVMERTSRRRK